MNKGSSVWRWFAAILLVVTAIPLWRALIPAPTGEMASAPGESWDVPGEIVVDLKDSATPGDLTALGQKYGVSFMGYDTVANPGEILTIKSLPSAVPALLARLRSDPMVEAAEPQRLFRALWKPNDPRYKEQWNFQRIHMEKAWDITKGKGAVVAVIDTGVAFEKDSKCYRARDFADTRFTDPYDFVFRDKHPTDDHGHGTHVAGTIAESTNNGEGVAGIAFEAKIMPLKVLTKDGMGRMSDVAAAIRYAADHKANVINMSLGTTRPDSVTHNACKYARDRGCTIVCAAGNSGQEGVGYPAAYPECIAVSALGPTGELTFYSSWGKQVAISAPGGDKTKGEDKGILQNTYLRVGSAGHDRADSEACDRLNPLPWDSLSAAQIMARPFFEIHDGSPILIGGPSPNGGDLTHVMYEHAGDTYEDGYFFFQGTSMASPHVAGVAALVVSQGVKDPGEVKAILQKTAQKRGPKEKYGAGEVDAAAAAKAAKGTSDLYYARLAILGAVWAGCLFTGGIRRKAGIGPVLALTIGLFLPDAVTYIAGFDSAWNLLGHSVLIPGYLLVFEAESPSERRFLGMLTAGIAAHVGYDLWQGISPAIGAVDWAALPWLWANVVIGAGAFISGLRR